MNSDWKQNEGGGILCGHCVREAINYCGCGLNNLVGSLLLAKNKVSFVNLKVQKRLSVLLHRSDGSIFGYTIHQSNFVKGLSGTFNISLGQLCSC